MINGSDISIKQGDANALLKDVADNSVNLIATDPPYEINFENNAWDKPGALNWEHLAKEFARVIKPNGGLVIFQGWSCVSETRSILDKHFTLKN